MAIEARHLNFFPSQLIGTREVINAIESNANAYNNQMGFGIPLYGTNADSFIPFYDSIVADSVPVTATTTMKAESGLTCNLSPVSRKRSRDSISISTNPLVALCGGVQRENCTTGPFSFLGEDISLQIQQQQLEIDRLITQHTEKVRFELAERRKRHSKRFVAAFEEGIVKKLKAKEEEIEKIRKLNWVLEERLKSLCVENQIWRELAQTNEATANVLRGNLEHVLSRVKQECHHGALADDAESCCGSSDFGEEEEEEEMRTLVENGGERKVVKDKTGSSNGSGSRSMLLMCRNCGKEESCVLLLPCRHLCLCTLCGSTIHTCPICKSDKNGSVHVNMY